VSKFKLASRAISHKLDEIKTELTADRPGRNEPCYCGSGKRYKQCHMADDRAADQLRRDQTDAATFLRRDLLKFAREERFALPFGEALALYWNNLYTADNAEEMSQHEALRFFDWFVFDYETADHPRLITVYHAEKQEDLTEAQRIVLDNWQTVSPAGAYELIAYAGQTLELRDVLDDNHYHVHEAGGRGIVEPGEWLLVRLVPVLDHLEFSTAAAYLPHDEIADLPQKLAALRAADAAARPDADQDDFLRRHNHLIIHHALEQAEKKGRPPVACLDPHRPDKLVQTAARQMKRFKRRWRLLAISR
jgi:hypothetical protein